jgi:hypothetical protein
MAVGSVQPFRPSGTTLIAATASTGFIPLVGGGDDVLVTNAGTALAFVAFGTDGTVTVTATAGTPVLPGSRLLLSIGGLITTAAVIMATGTANVYFTRGAGSFA